MVPTIIFLVMVLFLAGGGTVYASQDSLPGEMLYPLKLTAEQARLILADDATDTRLWLEFAGKRLDEISALNEMGRPEKIALAVSGYEQAISNSIAKLEGIKTEELSALVAESISNHFYILDNLEDVVPSQAHEALTQANQASLNGLENSIRALAGENPERAMEINLNAMEGRLNRIKAQAEAGNPVNDNGPLAQYEDLRNFGNEISEIARGLKPGTTTIDELITQATSIHLEVLSEVYEKVPEVAKESVEKAMENSIDGHQKATEALEQAGASDKIPDKLPVQPGMPDRIKEKLEETAPSKPDTTPSGRPPENPTPEGPPLNSPHGKN